MRWIPLDPPWLIVPVVAGMVLAAASISNENWSILVLWAGAGVAIICATLGFDREHRHPGGRLR